MKKIILALFIIGLLISGLIRYEKIKKEKAFIDRDIIRFKYYYGSGEGTLYEYNINYKDDKYVLTLKGFDFNNDKMNIEKEIDKNDIIELSKVIEDNNIKSWNGFDESEKGIFDGNGFSLEIEYKSGEKIVAHGYMKYPENYKESHKKLSEYLLKLSNKES